MSVEERRGRVDCGTQGVQETVSADRFRGVRIFDISNFDKPVQIAAVQTCRGSHTHTLVVRSAQSRNVYIYVSGTSGRPVADELEAVRRRRTIPNTSLFSIDVIRCRSRRRRRARRRHRRASSPIASTGAVRSLGGRQSRVGHADDVAERTSATTSRSIRRSAWRPAPAPATASCSTSAIPCTRSGSTRSAIRTSRTGTRATFNNDGTKVSSPTSGAAAPAALPRDGPPNWGADAIFDDRRTQADVRRLLQDAGGADRQENCVAHNGSLDPGAGARHHGAGWYQGGLSVFDFTDAAQAAEIAFFDRGPISAEKLIIPALLVAYWYNGHIYGSEMAPRPRHLPAAAERVPDAERAGRGRPRQARCAQRTGAAEDGVAGVVRRRARVPRSARARSKAVSANRISAARPRSSAPDNSSGKAQTSALDDVAKVAGRAGTRRREGHTR
jgi:hypothetical protein